MGASTALAKAAKQDEIVRTIADETEHRGMRVGSIYIDGRGRYYRIDSMKLKKRLDWDASEKAQKKAEGEPEFSYRFELKKQYEIHVDDVEVSYSCNDEDDDGNEFRPYGKHFLKHEFHYFKDWVLVDDRAKYEQLAQDIIDGKTEMPSMEQEVGGDDDTNTSLIHVKSKEHLQLVQQAAEERAKHFKIIQSNVNRVLEQKKAHLEGIRRNLGGIVEAFKKKVEKIQRVIYVIELYLGLNEEILQFQEGEKASIDEPITFRQRVMYMDEEVGDPRLDKYGLNEGLDFRNVEAFDEWLCANGNYKKVIPEPKCVCVFKVRRNKKQGHKVYCDNPFVSSWMENADKKTYILIRNGDNLYRIWVDLEVAERLFPHKDEIEQLQGEVLKHEGKGGWDEEKSKEKLETEHERYHRQFIMLQGLIDRTEILHPIKEHIALAKIDLDTTKLVRLIYDDGPSLAHAGHVPFKEWMADINSRIDEGSRIVITSGAERENERFDERFRKDMDSKYNLPKSPQHGLYTVFKKTDPRGFSNPRGYGERVTELLCIKYNPGGEVRNWWDRWDDGHERKTNLSYNIMKEDEFLLNFDEVSIKDIDYYLDSRIDRREYVVMMPVLWEVREHKRKEEEEENDFLLMLIAPYAPKYQQGVLLAAANEEMQWWKTKNKWKRSLKKDDAKAFRMIGNRLKKRFK